jgi:hypothetical protein
MEVNQKDNQELERGKRKGFAYPSALPIAKYVLNRRNGQGSKYGTPMACEYSMAKSTSLTNCISGKIVL